MSNVLTAALQPSTDSLAVVPVLAGIFFIYVIWVAVHDSRSRSRKEKVRRGVEGKR
jgi:hypothetical protein